MMCELFKEVLGERCGDVLTREQRGQLLVGDRVLEVLG